MGNLKIGWTYPPEIVFGTTPVSRVMCGSEQVWPRANGIVVYYERYWDAPEEDGWYIPIPRYGLPEDIDGVVKFFERPDGGLDMHFIDPSGRANNAAVINESTWHDKEHWSWEFHPEDHVVVVSIPYAVLEQTDYTSQEVFVEFSSDMEPIDVNVRIECPDYPDGTTITIEPDASYTIAEGYYNTYTVRAIDDNYSKRITHSYNRYHLTGIHVYHLTDEEYRIDLASESVVILREAFRRYHYYPIEIVWEYAPDPMLYVNFIETYRREGYDDFIDTYHGHVRYNNDTAACWFDKLSPAGQYTATMDNENIYIHVPANTPDGYEFIIEDFYNNTSTYMIGATQKYVRIPKSYCVANPSSTDQANLGWTLVRRKI